MRHPNGQRRREAIAERAIDRAWEVAIPHSPELREALKAIAVNCSEQLEHLGSRSHKGASYWNTRIELAANRATCQPSPLNLKQTPLNRDAITFAAATMALAIESIIHKEKE